MAERGFLPRHRLEHMVTALRDAGYAVYGPQGREGAIVYAPLQDTTALPAGVTVQQAPGSYHLERRDHPRQFAWANGPQALKPLLFTPVETLWRARRDASGRLAFEGAEPTVERRAVLGVRACDLAALALHDRHFLPEAAPDATYAARRKGLFLIAVNCSHPAATCFCASTGDGPVATAGYDLRLDELETGFVVEAGSDAGARLLAELAPAPITPEQETEVVEQQRAAHRQERALSGRNLRDALFANLEHPRWSSVAERCLSCGNCTSVCPTCFCHREMEEPTLDRQENRHYRMWDSCFTEGHSYIHGIVIRSDTRLRYRQWLTHKLGSWHEQYGRSGCVGCGRCISWCPVGIDLTAEAAALCAKEPA